VSESESQETEIRVGSSGPRVIGLGRKKIFFLN
jgi:hypothetical protein